MPLRPLIIDDEARAKVQRIREFAERRENWYLIAPGGANSGPVPGDNPAHVVKLNTYRCVFTWSRTADGKVYRHLSISVPSEKYPNPAAMCMIAELFGFTGWDGETIGRLPENWLARVNEGEHCITLAQELPIS